MAKARKQEPKQKMVKQSSCILLVVLAFLAGAFMGNLVTSLSGANRQVTGMPPSGGAAQESDTHERLEAMAAANPDDPAAWTAIGNHYFQEGRSAEAAEAYEKALALDPSLVGVWSDMGVMYRRLGRFDDAIAAFEHAASLDPSHETSRFNKGIVLLYDLNRKEEALAMWREVLRLNPRAKAPTGKPLSELVAEIEAQ